MTVGFNTTINSVERGFEKTGNNIKYGAATVATIGAGIGTAKLINKGKNVFSSINKETVKSAGSSVLNTLKNIGKKLISPDFYKGIFNVTKNNYDKVANSVKTTGVKSTLGKIGNTILGGIKSAGTKVLSYLPNMTTIKNGIGNFAKSIPPALKKVPVVGWIAAATGAALLLLAHKHGYNSGQIDQKYDDRQKLFEKVG